jgi:hypothetical protein
MASMINFWNTWNFVNTFGNDKNTHAFTEFFPHALDKITH